MNLQSMTAAIGWRGLFSAFAGKDSKPTPLASLLPFPSEFGDELKARSLSTATTEILHRLIGEGKLSNKVIAAAIALDSSLESALPDVESLPELPFELLM